MYTGIADDLEWLQSWYANRCAELAGNEHQEVGLSIESIDNPGWWFRVPLDASQAQRLAPGVLCVEGDPPSETSLGSAEWLLCEIREGVFHGAGDPMKLHKIIRVFREAVVEAAKASDPG
ncbi:MAG TPA: Imm53 family immunity protein [Polyangia bacterium]|jgi:hypothetical protein